MLKKEFIKRAAGLISLIVAFGGGVYWWHGSEINRLEKTSIFKVVGQLKWPSISPYVNTLADGRLVIIGRDGRIQIFNPENSVTQAVNRSGKINSVDSAIAINGNRILLACQSMLKIYFPQKNIIENVEGVNIPYEKYSVVRLNDGRALFAGGELRENACKSKYSGTLEIFDPKNSRFRHISSELIPGSGYKTVVLSDGRVVLFGGSYSTEKDPQYCNTHDTLIKEIFLFEPDKNELSKIGSWNDITFDYSATRLVDDRILLITAGYSQANNRIFIFDPNKRDMSEIESHLACHRMKIDSVLLPKGRVLIIGGGPACSEKATTAELFDPKTNTFQMIGDTKRINNDSRLFLNKGKVFLLGGTDPSISIMPIDGENN